MNIALCDDSPIELDEIRGYLEEYRCRRPFPSLTLFPFEHGEDLLRAAERIPFDLCLLDILMPGLSGIETARMLKSIRPAAAVVFLTSTPDFALDAFQVRAKNYLLKPVQADPLYAALDELLAAPRPFPVELAAEGGASVVVAVDRVLYLECTDHRVFYHLTDGTCIRGRTIRVPFLSAAAPLLESGLFLQPHRSYLINAEHILRLTGQSVILSDGTEIAVSQLRRREFRQQYMDYLSGDRP